MNLPILSKLRGQHIGIGDGRKHALLIAPRIEYWPNWPPSFPKLTADGDWMEFELVPNTSLLVMPHTH